MNILYLHTHDTGKVISPYGYQVHTPNYQSLCEDSVLFQNAYCVAPTCSPSRAGLLTGVYPHQNGMLGLAQRGFELNTKLHLASLLKEHGFYTALCGVQHEIGYYTDHQMAIGTLGYGQDLSADCSQYSEKELVNWDHDNAMQLVRWLKEYDKMKPFFVSYGMHATHREFPDQIHPDERADYCQPPLNLVNNAITRKDYARYKTSLRTADENVGHIVEALKETGLYENTIIILTTDHGLAYPFEKCTLTDSGIGVLFAMHVPGSSYHGHSYDGLISHIDVVPTICDLLGIEQPEYLEGKSFASVFGGNAYSGDEYIFSEINFHTSYEPARAVRSERYKYIRYFDTGYLKLNQSNIDDSEVKEFYFRNGLADITKEKEGLYDLYYDKFETRNLARENEYCEILEKMRAELHTFMIRTKDPLLDGAIPFSDSWKINRRECHSARSKNKSDYE